MEKTIDRAKYLKEVREQYENFPYPLRDPEEEKTRLYCSVTEELPRINHYCYKGKKNFFDGKFRALVAGGGTGDAIVFLAEQLRDIDADIVYVDMSKTSMEIAQQRAKVRNLKNITWIHNSLLEVPNLNLKKFDYVNCSGVLHHLSNPDRGLDALKAVLKDDGCMGIMVYAKYGRMPIYMIQDALRLLNKDEKDMNVKVTDTIDILKSLPATHWFIHANPAFSGDIGFGGIGIYDLFLHSKDRAFTVPELYEFVKKANLNFVDFIGLEDKLLYDPGYFIKEPELLAKVRKLSKMEQQAFAELLSCFIIKHTFYTSAKKDTVASIEDLDNVPFFHDIDIEKLDKTLFFRLDEVITINYDDRASIRFHPSKYSGYIVKYLDGERTLREIFDCVIEELKEPHLTHQFLLDEFRPLFEAFGLLDLMLLRHKSVKKFITNREMDNRVAQLYKT